MSNYILKPKLGKLKLTHMMKWNTYGTPPKSESSLSVIKCPHKSAIQRQIVMQETNILTENYRKASTTAYNIKSFFYSFYCASYYHSKSYILPINKQFRLQLYPPTNAVAKSVNGVMLPSKVTNIEAINYPKQSKISGKNWTVQELVDHRENHDHKDST